MTRSRRPRSSRALGIALVLVFVLAGCAENGGGSPDGDGSSDGETLASFFGYETDDDEADWEAQWRDQERQVQEHIRQCMAEKGFEYIPVEQDTATFAVHDDEDQEERVRRQGFGITTWYGETGEPIEDGDGWHDPNWERVDAMSEAEREAYYEALHGAWDDQDFEIEYDEETGEEYHTSYGFGGGCEGEAHQAIYGLGDPDDMQELWDELEPAYEALAQRIEADPRVVEWNDEWSACMATAGYDYASPEQMHETVFQEFERRMDDLLGHDEGWAGPFDGWSEADIEAFFEERTEDEIEAFFQEADAQHFQSIDQEALAALQQEEIDLAVADFECRDGKEFWELYEEVSRSYEADFIAENRGLLEQLRDAEGR